MFFKLLQYEYFWHWLHMRTCTRTHANLCFHYNLVYKLIFIFIILILSKNVNFNERKKSLISRINTFLFKWHRQRKTSCISVTSVIYLVKKSNNHFSSIIALVGFLIYNKLLSYNIRPKFLKICNRLLYCRYKIL